MLTGLQRLFSKIVQLMKYLILVPNINVSAFNDDSDYDGDDNYDGDAYDYDQDYEC